MQDLRAAFLAAIREAPDEDGPRLVYADWLEENAEEEHAEFIRVQVALARLREEDSEAQAVFAHLDSATLAEFDWGEIDAGVGRRAALEARSAALAQRHSREWKAAEVPAVRGMSWTYVERGILAGGKLTGPDVLARAGRGASGLRYLDVWRDMTVDQARRLVGSGALDGVVSLSLLGNNTGLIEALGESPAAAGVRAVSCYSGAGEVARLVASSPRWRGLRSLEIHNDATTAEVSEALFRAPHLKGLARLRIWGDRWTPDTVRALAEGALTGLRDLELFQCDLDDEDAEVLAHGPALRRLRALALPTSRLGGAGASALLASPALRKLAVLDLWQNNVRRLDAARLAGGRSSPLRVLSLSSNRLMAADVRVLWASPVVRGLYGLALEANGLGDSALRTLADARFGRLASLDLLYNRLGDAGVSALAASPSLATLRSLHLNGNDFGEAGALALAASPYLDGLCHLCANEDKVGRDGMKALRKRFGTGLKVL